jgi:hypothetical protein
MIKMFRPTKYICINCKKEWMNYLPKEIPNECFFGHQHTFVRERDLIKRRGFSEYRTEQLIPHKEDQSNELRETKEKLQICEQELKEANSDLDKWDAFADRAEKVLKSI